jgi:cell division protein FtsL
MAAVAERAARRAERSAPKARPRTARQRPARAQRRVAGGVVTIVAVAALLAGVVALNVAVLRLNLRLDDLSQQRVKLRAENAALSSKLASSAATPRIQQVAAHQLGVSPATPEQTNFVNLAKR